LQFQFQRLAIHGSVEAGHAMFMGAEAAVLVFMLVIVALLVGVGDEGQQGKGQGKHEKAHKGISSAVWKRNVITNLHFVTMAGERFMFASGSERERRDVEGGIASPAGRCYNEASL
jgi:hypothetical protein